MTFLRGGFGWLVSLNDCSKSDQVDPWDLPEDDTGQAVNSSRNKAKFKNARVRRRRIGRCLVSTDMSKFCSKTRVG